MSSAPACRVALLAGGVGGARMARGLAQVLPPEALTIIVNVGDDDDFHGLRVCPDLDTILYTLSGQIHPAQGWGLADDTTNALAMLRRLGAADTWMTLGDGDIGLHLYRSARLRAGVPLSIVTAELAQAFGVGPRLLPASDQPVATRIRTEQGELRFQEWFVQQRGQPTVRGLRSVGAEAAQPAPGVLEALAQADLIVLAPSNPLLSIEPILRIPGLEIALRDAGVPRVAVSPLIGGQAVKGPLTRLLHDLGLPSGTAALCHLYDGLVDTLVIDDSDAADRVTLPTSSITLATAPLLIDTAPRAAALAQQLLQLAHTPTLAVAS